MAPDGRFRHVVGLEEISRRIEQCGIECYWTEERNLLGWCDLERRRIFLHPQLFEADPWVIRNVVYEELGHLLTSSPSDEVALDYVHRFHEAETQPETPIIRYGPELLDTDTMLALVEERTGWAWWEIEERAEAEGISVRELCLMLLANDEAVVDPWLMAA